MLADGTNRYLYGMGRIAQQTPNGLQYFLPDALGSARQLTNAAGALALVQSFDPYGGLHSSQGSTATPYGFTGEWGDASGLLHLRARYYLPQAGIFTSRDIWIGDLTAPASLNRYGYSYGNPVRYIDPDGHWPCSISDSGFNCSVSTFGVGASLDRFGNNLGVGNASDIVSKAASNIGLGFDLAAEATDVTASTIVTAGITVGATSGAAITLPGGGTAVVTGAAGASVRWAIAEIGVKPLIIAGNILASIATGFTIGSELISGDTGFESTLGVSTEGVELKSQIAIGSSSQVSFFATTAGWISPLAYPSLLIQTGAVLGDLGIISPCQINKEFRLKWGEEEK